MATIFTIGHSTRSLEEFVILLKAHAVQAIADVRRFPGSKRLPQFNAERLAVELPARQIEYLPCPLLGGRRRPAAESVNTAWRNASFRAYADYMQTGDFAQGLAELMESARQRPTAMMCAEAVPWRCHRSLIADALIVRGWTVMDIMSPTRADVHKLTPFAHVEDTAITYPGEDQRQGSLFG